MTEMEQILRSLSSLENIQQCFNEYQKAGFPKRPPEFFALELAGEAGEVANNEKKLWKGREVGKAHLADEAADVFIALLNYANSRGILLSEAVRTKLQTIDRIRIERKGQGLEY